MRKLHAGVACLACLAIFQFAAKGTPPAVEQDTATVVGLEQAYGRLPLHFEANVGQVPGDAEFLSRGKGYALTLAATETVMAIRGTSGPIRMKLLNADPLAKGIGIEPLPGRANYFAGSDSTEWRTGIGMYAKVRYGNVYPGIDIVYYGNQQELEYDFVVSPGADPHVIKLGFEGLDSITLSASGDLILRTGNEEVRQKAPRIHQQVDGVMREIEGGYRIGGSETVGFALGEYDPDIPLVIDPVLVYSTYLGGSGSDRGLGVAVDASGNAYLTGITTSTNFPFAGGPQATNRGGGDAFVVKLNASGTSLLYATFIGGSEGDTAMDIAVDGTGNAYVSGYTESADFPVVNALQSVKNNGVDSFVAKLDASGSSLVFSTFLGGSDEDLAFAVAIDSNQAVLVAGTTFSTDFPTAGAWQDSFGGGFTDGFVARIQADGSNVAYSSYIGGSGEDGCMGLAVDSAGNAHVVGITNSTNFPVESAFQPSYRGGTSDAFVAKLNPSGSAPVYSSYLGGAGDDWASDVAVDHAGNAYFAGITDSNDFPLLAAIQSTSGGGNDAFVTKLNASGGVSYATYLGGSGLEGAAAITVDNTGSAYVTGSTTSRNFPVVDPLQTAQEDAFDIFVSKLNPVGDALAYSTYFGGSGSDYGLAIASDASGNVYVLGQTASLDLPLADPVQAAIVGSDDVFITKISSQAAATETTLNYPRLVSRSRTRNDEDDSQYTGIAIANLGNRNAALKITAFDTEGKLMSSGNIVNPVAKILPPGAQIALADFQLLGNGLPYANPVGWFKVESTVRQIAGFFLIFNNGPSILDGADVSSSTTTSFVFPEIEFEEFTQFHVANPNAAPANVVFELSQEDGTLQMPAVSRVVAAGGSLSEYFYELFPGIIPFGSNYVRVSSDRGVVPFEFLGKSGKFVEGLNGQDASSGSTTLYSPQYVVGGSTYWTTLSVVNLDPLAGLVTLRFRRDDGTQIGSTRQLPILPRGKIYITDQDYFIEAGSNQTQGYLEITSNGPTLAGSVTFGDPERQNFSSALPLVSNLRTAFVFSQLASDKEYFTGIAILNPNNTSANAVIEVFDAKGRVLASKTEILGAGQRKSQVLTQYFPLLDGGDYRSGYIKVTVDKPVAAFALFGTRDNSTLAAVPPQVIP